MVNDSFVFQESGCEDVIYTKTKHFIPDDPQLEHYLNNK